MFRRAIVLAMVVMTWAPASSAAQVYQWTDADGVKHYTNKPPPDSVTVEAVEKEIAHDPEAERLKAEKDAAVMREIEAQDRRRQSEARDQAAREATQTALDDKSAELDAAEEKILNKRKYLNHHGRQDINAFQRLDRQIEALKGDPAADPAEIRRLEAERDAVKQKIYTTPRRARKGVDQDIKDYQDIEKSLEDLKEKGSD